MSNKNEKLTKEENKMLREAFILSGMTKTGSDLIVREGKTFAVTMLPVINRFYKNEEKKAEVFYRHAKEYYNTNPVAHGLIVGVTLAMEKENAQRAESEDMGGVITNLKASLMGPLAGIGDSLMFNCLRVIMAGIALGFSTTGSIFAPLVFLIGYGGVGLVLRYILMRQGYIRGEAMVTDYANSSVIPILTKAASVLGGIMVGAMVAKNVSITFALTHDFNGSVFDLQAMMDSIVPGIMSILLFFIVMNLVRKGISSSKIIYGIVLVCIVLAFFGIF